jgi:hypothetical protein
MKNVENRGVLGAIRRGATLGLVSLLAACGAPVDAVEVGTVVEGDLDSTELGISHQRLTSEAWRNWQSDLLGPTGIDTEVDVCSNRGGSQVFVARDWNQRFFTRSRTGPGGFNPEWAQFSFSKQFSSAPSCTFQYSYPNRTNNRFIIAGKVTSTDGTNNRIHVLVGEDVAVIEGATPANPKFNGSWEAVSTTQYSGNNGLPALTTSGGLAPSGDAGRVVVAFLDNNTIYAHVRPLPYANNRWGARTEGLALPRGVTASGTPAITYIKGSTRQFIALVTASTSRGPRLYWTYFNGAKFVKWNAAPVVSPRIDSDPAVEYDTAHDALTVYFRSGNDIYQQSVPTAEQLFSTAYPLDPVRSGASAVLYGAPRVNFGGGIEQYRVLIVRGYGEQSPLPGRAWTFLLNDQARHDSPWLE